ncbi:hypothetical protein [Clostridium oryzae]|uniref:Uncharacterized protein n=1 Tax=Clostridium oryzae TaxID=1450648 RepID=A0A1V4ISS3_9CLOT|nr:hypothetical protein [Clostridium oryzae]OPJ63062.1 hypothetical protein CLORY_14280 [Clostridium oryzae]
MKKILTVFLLLVLSFSIIDFKSNAYDKNSNIYLNKVLDLKLKSSTSKNKKRIFYGTWIIKKAIAYGRVTAYGNKEIKKMIGKKLTYLRHEASYDNNVLKQPYYKISSISRDEFFSYSYTDLSKLGIKKKSIKMVEIFTNKSATLSWDSTGNYCFIKNKDTLILLDGGVYFKLVRKSNEF